MKPILLTLLAVACAFRQNLIAEELTCLSAAERETAESRPAAANVDSQDISATLQWNMDGQDDDDFDSLDGLSITG